ncbi:PTS transporter subunit EIIC [Streptomyces sp. NPDC048659]|uniref:PTS sugar transporter subunit IIC n=1 Tax=Streptomyces sp. NPDC048659 TaxID=3155489 RepID=UPI003419765E
MNTAVAFLSEKFAPRINKLTQNAWVQGLQTAMLGLLPFILAGSIITLVGLIPGVTRAVPSVGDINSYTFGMLGIFAAFLIPFSILDKMGGHSRKMIGGLTGIGLFLFLLKPALDADGIASLEFAKLGAGGMFVSIVGGVVIAAAFHLFAKFSFFKNNTALPSFVINWFDSLLPILCVMTAGWLVSSVGHLDAFQAIVDLFYPLTSIAQTYPGFLLLTFAPIFFYSFGVSGWVLFPLCFPIWMDAVQQNAQNGTEHIFTYEVVYVGFTMIGGMGCTLLLVALMCFRARSQRLRVIGRATAVPSLFNINEPVIFGAPVAFNPLLMIPLWLNGLVIPSLTYFALDSGLVPVPGKVFSLWYLPYPVGAFVVSGIAGALLVLALAAVSLALWFPFFRAYDSQVLAEERAEAEQAAAREAEQTVAEAARDCARSQAPHAESLSAPAPTAADAPGALPAGRDT